MMIEYIVLFMMISTIVVVQELLEPAQPDIQYEGKWSEASYWVGLVNIGMPGRPEH